MRPIHAIDTTRAKEILMACLDQSPNETKAAEVAEKMRSKAGIANAWAVPVPETSFGFEVKLRHTDGSVGTLPDTVFKSMLKRLVR